MSKQSFAKVLKQKTKMSALEYLNKEKANQILNIEHQNRFLLHAYKYTIHIEYGRVNPYLFYC